MYVSGQRAEHAAAAGALECFARADKLAVHVREVP